MVNLLWTVQENLADKFNRLLLRLCLEGFLLLPALFAAFVLFLWMIAVSLPPSRTALGCVDAYLSESGQETGAARRTIVGWVITYKKGRWSGHYQVLSRSWEMFLVNVEGRAGQFSCEPVRPFRDKRTLRSPQRWALWVGSILALALSWMNYRLAKLDGEGGRSGPQDRVVTFRRFVLALWLSSVAVSGFWILGVE